MFLAARVPIIGDEAYYVMWGKYPSLGYYDHPPVIGWLLALVRLLGTSSVALRLPAILLVPALAPLFVAWIRPRVGASRAYRAGSLFALAPVHALNFWIATDVPLVFFSFVGLYLYDRSLREERPGLAAAAGTCLGLAFLSKYFAALIILAVVAHAALFLRSRAQWGRLAIAGACALPFALFHVYWSATHCWATIFFNASGRNFNQWYRPENVRSFLLYQLYLLGPALLYVLIRYFRRFAALARDPSGSLYLIAFLLPVLCFFYSSFHASQGLHWTLAFYPFLYLAAGLAVDGPALGTATAIQGAYTGAQALAAIGIALVPVSHWKDRGFYGGLMLSFQAPGIARALERETPADVRLASDGYTEASLLEIFSDRRVSVIGDGVLFGREDDLLTDFRDWDGKDVLIFTRHARTPAEYAPYFRSIDRTEWVRDGMRYYLFHGHRFDYARYRDHVLAAIRDQYYARPKGFSPWACYMTDRYFRDPAASATLGSP